MPSRVLYCHCAFAQAVPRPVKQDVLRALTDSGADFDAVADLCEMSARKDPALKEFASCEHLTLVACYPRALRWMFSAAGAPLDESRVRVLNMRAATAEAITAALNGAPLDTPDAEPEAQPAIQPGAQQGAHPGTEPGAVLAAASEARP
jgi:hypothetical protein